MKKKKVSIMLGVALGISASIFAMIPTTQRSQAAIAVWDEKNIAQAIEMVSRTTQILSDEDKQLALAILNAKKLDSNMILNYVNKTMEMDKKSGFGWGYGTGTNGDFSLGKLDQQYRNSNGQFDGTAAVEQAWIQRLGDLQGVLNGSTTLAGAAIAEYNREEALNKTFLEAAVTAQKTQESNQAIAQTLNQLVSDSMNAEGEVQIMQLGNSINAQNVLATLMLSRQVARGIQAEAAYYQSKNLERAQQMAEQKRMQDKAAEALKSMPTTSNP